MTLIVRPGYLAEGDPSFSNVSLLLHGNGTNGSTTITDSGPSPKTVTAFDGAQISTAQSKFGGSSILFDGNNDYILPAASDDFAFGALPFTVECWVYLNGASASSRCIWGFGPSDTNSFELFSDYIGNTKITFHIYGGSSIVAPTTLNNQWVHVAVVREGIGSLQTKMYINGVIAGSATFSSDSPIRNMSIGRGYFNVNTAYFNGWVDDFRVTKGIARYTANFTPPDAPFPDAQY
jgi:hypothetical protein